MLPFESCCFCCKLETGAYVLGILGLVACMAYTMLFSVAVVYVNYAWLIGLVFPGAFFLAFLLLIIGTNRRNKWLALPYILLASIATAVNALVVIYLIISNDQDPSAALVIVGISVISIPFGVQNVLSMISLFMKFNSEGTKGLKDEDY
ncbi:unnamed protein product [Hermetia illucens]|uniref:Uncharacterized protein n=1 Tax=Hermetia illucens TaxID=343691 RepID=A0A7R8YMI9_HERIL|nr:uncharacterized protein LOC119661234 [Hermetia illucens]CAD7078226.1 unnamed protein product [Hermetia illucens]